VGWWGGVCPVFVFSVWGGRVFFFFFSGNLFEHYLKVELASWRVSWQRMGEGT